MTSLVDPKYLHRPTLYLMEETVDPTFHVFANHPIRIDPLTNSVKSCLRDFLEILDLSPYCVGGQLFLSPLTWFRPKRR